MRTAPGSNLSSPDNQRLPEVVFTIGDPHGIGAEVLLKALFDLRLAGAIRPIVFGSEPYLRMLARELGLGSLPDDWQFRGDQQIKYPPRWGRVDPAAGKAAWNWLEQAVDYCRTQHSRLLVTAPIHKQAIRQAGFPYPGHTEYLAQRFQCERTVMAFFSKQLVVALVTIHIPLTAVPQSLHCRQVCETAILLREALIGSGLPSPRLALCGLNPHASEGGLFGEEEAKILKPAVQAFQDRFGQGLEGPLPADTLFYRASQGEFDGVVALYHDQGLIPMKLLAFDCSTNVTLGLPLVRTSPDHGTAFDIAGKNQADPGSMISSVEWGLRLAQL